MKDKNQKSIALSYAANGWRVVPLHSVSDGGDCSCQDGKNCKHPGKHPQTRHGVKDATSDREQIKAWWKKWPGANIGVATGRKSGIVVIDADPRNGSVETLEKLREEFGRLPKTVKAKTGGSGRHYIFRYPDLPIRSDSSGRLLGPGLDVLAEGKYFVAPRSRHLSGHRYRWINGRSIDDIKPAVLPAPWLARLRKERIPNKPEVTPSDPVGEAGIIREGDRNGRLTRLAGTLWRNGLSSEALVAALATENRTRCRPPLDNTEIERIAGSITKYPAPVADEQTDDAETIVHEVLAHQFAGGKHLSFGIDGRFWYYDVRLWRRVPDEWINGRILEVIQTRLPRKGKSTASLIGQARTLLGATLAVKDDPFRFAGDPPPVINCQNGELWILDDGLVELRSHRPESHLRHCLDVEYDPEATCPVYDKAVRGIFAAAKYPKSLVRHWNELAGYLIQARRSIPLVVILNGTGNNGKTKLIRTVIRILGEALVEARRVEDLDKSHFAMGSLLNKLIFYDDDVKAGIKLPDGILKTISEAKEVTGEHKYKDSFNFIVRTVPILLCNNIPSLADLSHGMQRRLMVIPFDRKFTEADDELDIFDRIWANELPGVFNRLLEGLGRVIRRGYKFKYPTDVKLASASFIGEANPVPDFIQEECVVEAKARCLLRDFYQRYQEWAKETGITLIPQQRNIRRNLEHLNYPIKHNNQGAMIQGLSLKNHPLDD